MNTGEIQKTRNDNMNTRYSSTFNSHITPAAYDTHLTKLWYERQTMSRLIKLND